MKKLVRKCKSSIFNTFSQEAVLKPTIMLLVGGVGVSAEFIKVYLLSEQGIEKIGASVLMFTISHFTIEPVSALTNQSATFVAEAHGKIKKLSAVSLDDLDKTESKTETDNTDNLQEKITVIIHSGWLASVILSMPISTIFFSINPILRFLGQNEKICSIVAEYFFPIAFVVPLQFILNINERMLPAIDKERWLIPYKISMSLLGIGLNLALIPGYGSKGAGLALAMQNIFGFITMNLLLHFKTDLKFFSLVNFSGCRNEYRQIMKMLKQGWPLALGQLTLTGTNLAVTIFLGHLGPLRLAIEQSALQYLGILTTLIHGISEASNRLIAQARGTQSYGSLRRYGNISLLTSISLFSSVALVYNFYPLQLTAAFLDEETLAQSEDLIRYTFILTSLAKLFSTVVDVCGQNLAGMQDTVFSALSMFVTTLALILPLSAISTYLTDFDLYGIGAAIDIGLFAAAATTAGYWFKLSNQAVAQNNFDVTKDTSNAKLSKLTCFFKKPRPMVLADNHAANEVVDLKTSRNLDYEEIGGPYDVEIRMLENRLWF